MKCEGVATVAGRLDVNGNMFTEECLKRYASEMFDFRYDSETRTLFFLTELETIVEVTKE